MRKSVFILLSFLFIVAASIIWISCGGGSSGGGSSAGTVALYATDDMGEYEQVTFTINSVSLEHKGTGDTCVLLTSPVTLDITDLSSMLQLLDVTSCPTVNYNRVHIEFSEQLVVTDGDITTTCNFTSYKDKGINPNVLICNDGNCTIDMNGAVNVFASQTSEMALDFDLKEFVVNGFDSPDCSVSMKVYPLNGDDINDKKDNGNYYEGISGSVSNVSTDDNFFTLTTESGYFTVTYTDIAYDGLNDILTLAAADGLKATVITSNIDLNNHKIVASAIYVEVEGTMSDLDTDNKTFTLTYSTNKNLTVDYLNADEVEGFLDNAVIAEVKLNGYDGLNFLAKEVEVEQDQGII